MEIQTNISNPGLLFLIFIALSVALGYTVYFFRKNNEEFTNIQRYILSGVKFIYVLLIAILLLAPLTEIIRNKIEKPLIVLGIDNSESMQNDSSNHLHIQEFIATAHQRLGDKYQIETLLFGERVVKSDSVNFFDQRTNYYHFLGDLEKRYFNLNVGAIVIIGDGIYNEGRNPGQFSGNIEAPIYTIGVGDTIAKMDQAIIDVTHNPNVFKGNIFPVEVELMFTEFPQEQTQLSIYLDGKLAVADRIDVLQPDFYFRNIYNISTEEVGLRNVSIVLSPIKDEQNTKNNRYNFTIEVHDNKKEVLFLTQGPHPDIGAITQTLNQLANYNITTSPIALYRGEMKGYDLVVLNQLPSLMSQQMSLYTQLKESKQPVLVIVGPNTSIAALNNLELGFSLTPSLLNEDSESYFNELFSIFTLPNNIKEIEKIYPPLLTHFTEYTYNPDFSVLAYQKIKGIEMTYPLIMTGFVNNRKVGAIMGEGIWRWRLREFQNYDNQNVFNQLIINLFSYLTLDDEHEQFKIFYERIASETSPYQIKTQVFNEIYEPVGNAEVKLVLKDSANSEMSYLFDVNQLEYNLNLGFLAPGTYSFEASATLGNSEFIKKGNFSIQEVNVEQQSLQSNFKVLNLMSENSGGRFFHKEEKLQLIQLLQNNQLIQPKIHQEKNIFELIDWKWYILIIFLLLTLEWFLRKFWGSY